MINEAYSEILRNSLRANQIFYYRLDERTGVTVNDLSPNSLNAVYDSVILDGGNGPDGISCPFFDSINNWAEYASNPALGIAWTNREEFSGIVWVRVTDASVLTDGIVRTIIEVFTDANNNMDIRKQAANNQFRVTVELNGQVYSDFIDGITTTDWFSIGFRIFEAGGGNKTLITYINGVQVGSDTEVTQDWTGAPDKHAIGSNRSGLQRFWDGNISHVIFYNGDIGDQAMKDLGRI